MTMRNAHPCLTALTSILLAATSACVFAQASAWPTKPVTIVTFNVPGGGGDLESRVYAEKLAPAFGKPFIMEYKPGAGSTLAIAYVAKAVPDGHTLLATSTSFVVVPAFYPNLGYDPIKDIAAVSMMTTSPIALIASPSFPPNNIKEYIAYARANPGKILWATNGAGAAAHLSGIWLHDAIGAEATFVHYKSGTQAASDLMAGRVHVQPRSLADTMASIKSGKMKAIASFASKRDPLMPDMLTAQEAGIKDFEQPNFFGIATTGGTDRAIVNRLSAELARIAMLPDVRQKMEAGGNVMVGNSADEFGKYLSSQINVFKKLVKEKNIKIDTVSETDIAKLQ